MRIYDCFMYFDEDLILETRLNILNKYVDYFVIVESKFNHKGEKRKLKFDLKKFKKFKDKIKYLIVDKLPSDLEKIELSDNNITKEHKLINNAVKRENSQRNFIENGLEDAHEDDFVLISDLDEIPCLENLDFNRINEKILIFEQIMTYYKFDLALPNYKWFGTKGCLKKNLKNPQWLRNVKSKKYKLYRVDIIFSEKKFNNIKFIKKGGWHFTNIKTPKEIEHKYKSYLHHREYELSGMSVDKIREIIKNKKTLYNLSIDQRNNKIGNGVKLKNVKNIDLPDFILKNKKRFSKWFNSI